jgi:DNA (cytosine-5)-methyltransferase 1
MKFYGQTCSELMSGQIPLWKHPVLDYSCCEFFAGIGLMRLGLEQAGWKIVYANDISKDKRTMYAGQFSDTDQHFALDDIHSLDASVIPSTTLATASFPCTDLSLAGGRKGLAGKKSSAYWGFVSILEKLKDRRPPLILLENVVGFLTSHQGRDFEEALLALNKLGYAVDAIIVDAAEFVPQSRVRLFVIGYRIDLLEHGTVSESSAFYGSAVRPNALADYIFTHPNICWHIRTLPALPQRQICLRDIIEDLPESSDCWWNRQRTDYLISQMAPRHTEKLLSMKAADHWSYGTVFRRVRNGKTAAEMRTDGIAGCLRTPRGGSARQILVKAGFGQVHVRLLIPRECARLMGADTFPIEVPLNQALFGFGDAVCVPVVTWIANNYLNPVVEEMRERCKTNYSQN